MSNLPVDPYDRTYVVEPPIDNPDRAPLGGTGKDFVVTLTDVHETPGADHMFLSRTGKWVVFGTTELTSWGNIVGDITQQDDLMALFALYTPTDQYARVAFTGNYNDLSNLPPLGTVSPINLNGSTSMFLRGDGNWAIPVDVNAQWGNINGDINAQTDLMALLALKAPLANPIFTGNPQAPTPPVDNNSKSIATTEWFFGQAFNGTPQMDGVASSGNSTLWARGNHRHPSDTTKIGDAPNDGQQYARQSQTWTVVAPPAGGGGGVWIGDTPPSDTTKYPFWWSSASLQLSIWYNDGNSSQWVDTNAEPDTLQGASGPWLLADGTVAAPGLAWASEPGLGWFKYVDSSIGMAAGGHTTRLYDAGYPNYKNTTDYLYAGVANGSSKMLMSNQPFSAVNANYFMLAQNTDGSALIRTTSAGSAAVGNLTLDTPQALFLDGTLAAPSIAFASEPGLGLYRKAASIFGFASGGIPVGVLDSSNSVSSLWTVTPRASGSSYFILSTQPYGATNLNALSIGATLGGYAIYEALGGTATAKQLTMTFPAGIVMNNGLNLFPAAGSATAGASFATRATNGWASLYLDSMTGGRSLVSGAKNGSPRWDIVPGESTAESGGNLGSDFAIFRYSDTGTFLGTAFFISRADGRTVISSTTPICLDVQNPTGSYASIRLNSIGTGNKMIRCGPGNQFEVVNSGNTAVIMNLSDAGHMSIPGNFGSLNVTVSSNGFKPGGGAWADSNSDERSKDIIGPYTRGLEDILAYEPIAYRFKEGMEMGDKVYVGRTSQAVKKIDPSMVMSAPVQGMGYDDLETIDSTPDIYKIINAIKELNAKIEALQ